MSLGPAAFALFRTLAKTSAGTISHCKSGDSPVPIHGTIGISSEYAQALRTLKFSVGCAPADAVGQAVKADLVGGAQCWRAGRMGGATQHRTASQAQRAGAPCGTQAQAQAQAQALHQAATGRYTLPARGCAG